MLRLGSTLNVTSRRASVHRELSLLLHAFDEALIDTRNGRPILMPNLGSPDPYCGWGGIYA
jgi:hypothetical protein